MGGRYQITQVDLSKWSFDDTAVEPLVFSKNSDSEVGSRFSPPGVFRSEDPPGVLGAPKDAKAPEPKPKAEEALVDGEETPPERGERALKGFDRPWELSGPKRFAVRGISTLAPPSFPSVPVIDRESLEVLQNRTKISISFA